MANPYAGYIGDAVEFTRLHHADGNPCMSWAGSLLCQAVEREQVGKAEKDNLSHDLTNVQVFCITLFVVLCLEGSPKSIGSETLIYIAHQKIQAFLFQLAKSACGGVSRQTIPVMAGFSQPASTSFEQLP